MDDFNTDLTFTQLPQTFMEEVVLPRATLESVKLMQSDIDPVGNMKAEADRQVHAGVTKLEENNQFDPVELVYNNLGAKEGIGDNLTDVPTGSFGVTAQARSAINAPDEMPDEEVAREYLGMLNRQWAMRNGYAEAPEEIKAMLLDAAYNMGEQTMNFPNLTASLAAGEWGQVARELLDTANVDGMGVKGIAKRRAESYNLYASPEKEIHTIEQLNDGTIVYRGEDGGEMFSYRPEGGRHPKSQAGSITL